MTTDIESLFESDSPELLARALPPQIEETVRDSITCCGMKLGPSGGARSCP